ncbi:hypothetical protein M404DRAFT_792698 [Pisolithus tinctorius Marx 270]|uniref:Uncharacterized protein n=1 Tax=Pisolithus tinctorius Marx 270 TaxID=870435 RepID=A0A0C3KPT8_PISTI|nr:hypothetical protein M404DRAFT_792698 [Pisolithus tinctorius Marx 270]
MDERWLEMKCESSSAMSILTAGGGTWGWDMIVYQQDRILILYSRSLEGTRTSSSDQLQTRIQTHNKEEKREDKLCCHYSNENGFTRKFQRPHKFLSDYKLLVISTHDCRLSQLVLYCLTHGMYQWRARKPRIQMLWYWCSTYHMVCRQTWHRRINRQRQFSPRKYISLSLLYTAPAINVDTAPHSKNGSSWAALRPETLERVHLENEVCLVNRLA